MKTTPRTLYEKIWDAHVVSCRDDGTVGMIGKAMPISPSASASRPQTR